MLDIKKRYLHTSSYLNQTREIWAHEVLDRSPSHWAQRSQEMLQDLNRLSHYQKWRLLTHKDAYLEIPLSAELYEHFKLKNELTSLESAHYDKHLKLPSWAFQKVRKKKQHEISVLAQELQKLRDQLSVQKLVDIGGGQGHFARVMSHYFQWDTVCVERETELIQLGLNRLKKHPAPKGCADLKLVQLDFQGLQTQEPHKLISLFEKDTFSLGLHTCGPLAVHHIQTHKSFQTRGLLNFGCCYGKIKNFSDLNLSPTSKEAPVNWNTPALNLAARAHAQLSYPDFCLQERIKSYRYALGLFLQKNYPNEAIECVGDSPTRDYLASFSHYAKLKFKFIQIHWEQRHEKELKSFYDDFSTHERLNELFNADILRWSFGRILEMAILLDRALYLSEDKEQKVSLMQFFDEAISPRNIGLLSYRETLSED